MADYSFDTLIIGTGCAGYNAADHLCSLGRRSIAIITEGREHGTSRNTGSDKQTYYTSALSSAGDSVRKMAKDLFSGGMMHGDTALIEAACSARCFFKLADKGVPFPADEYGEYVGYRTDHDTASRATSAGPLTSRYMTLALEKSVAEKGIRVFDGLRAAQIIVRDNKVKGLLCADGEGNVTSFASNNIILATGGPAGIYSDSVYPRSQSGSLGLAVRAGAHCANLHCWQYGLSSVGFRWNVSGSYQQVLPRYISVGVDGDEYELLPRYFPTPSEALDMVFLKGYQWPFDTAKLSGSSVIDLIVHRETHILGRRVFLDYTTDPSGLENGLSALSAECREYLLNCGATGKTPAQRLERMNPDALKLYRDNGIDLYTQPLEVAVCAQHHNGGIAVDGDWQGSVQGLYAAGEAAGTFGLYRPGGSALNSTQVGSMRAAQHIAYTKMQSQPDYNLKDEQEKLKVQLSSLKNSSGISAEDYIKSYTIRMSACAGPVRDTDAMQALRADVRSAADFFFGIVKAGSDIKSALAAWDSLCSMEAILGAMIKDAEQSGSVGGALIQVKNGTSVSGALPEYTYKIGSTAYKGYVLTTSGEDSRYGPVRPIPQAELWYETVWRRYNEYINRGRSE
ncbi:MAG: FAD-binding protein [Eubacteriales bacterium]